MLPYCETSAVWHAFIPKAGLSPVVPLGTGCRVAPGWGLESHTLRVQVPKYEVYTPDHSQED